MNCRRWQVLKNGLPVLVCPTIEIAEAYYLQYGCDEIREIEDEKENRMKTKGTVYVLEEEYKDNGPEIAGVFDSMKALCLGFADRIATDRFETCATAKEKFDMPKYVEDLVKTVANDVATLLPALLHVEGADDECIDGRTRYGVQEHEVETTDSSDEEQEDEVPWETGV